MTQWNGHTVETDFPPGCLIRRKSTGQLYVMGVRHGLVNFWVMTTGVDPRKGLVHATQIIGQFERLPANDDGTL